MKTILITLSLLITISCSAYPIENMSTNITTEIATGPKKSKNCKVKKRAYKKHGIKGLTQGRKTNVRYKKSKKKKR